MSPLFGERLDEADWLHLGEDEEIRWAGRPARITLVPAGVASVGLLVIGIVLVRLGREFMATQGWPVALGYLPGIIAVAGAGFGLYVYLRWVRLLYVVTDDAIYVKVGLVSRDVTQVPFGRVQNTAYSQSVLERLLGFGTIYVYTAGSNTEDLVFERVPRPARVKETISGQLRERPRSEGI